jgi:hypothetical protein
VALISLHPVSTIANNGQIVNRGLTLRINRPYQPDTLMIMLDNRDITALAQPAKEGLFLPPMPNLTPGKHTILLSFDSLEGYHIMRRFEIETDREELDIYQGTTGFGITLRGKLYDRNDFNAQKYEADAHIGHEGEWVSDAWSGEARADIWMFERGTDIDPLQDGKPEVMDYYASARYRQAENGLLAEVGYIQMHQSQNTMDHLARRGFQASVEQQQLGFTLFTANSQQYLGSDGGAGLGTGDDDTIAGFSADWNLAGDALQLRAIYSKGSDSGDSFGQLDSQTPNAGDVKALVVTSELDGLDIELEYDQSSFDADTSDTSNAIEDEAWGIRLKARSDWFNYRIAAEHIGAHYEVVSNPLLQNDREYISFGLNRDRGEHGFGLSTLVERDNLDDEPSRATLQKSFVTLDYHYRTGPKFNSIISLQQQQLESSDEQALSDQRDNTANTLLAQFNYSDGARSHLLNLMYSEHSDHIDSANDSEIKSLTYSPSIYTGRFSFIPSYSVSTTDFRAGQEIEQYVLSLHLQGHSKNRRLSYQLSASLSDRNDNVNGDSSSTYLVARTDWNLAKSQLMTVRVKQTVGLELEWLENENPAVDDQDEALAWLTYRIFSDS